MHFEEFTLGYRFRTRGRTVTEADLVNFVNLAWFTEELFTNTEDRSTERIRYAVDRGIELKLHVVQSLLVNFVRLDD